MIVSQFLAQLLQSSNIRAVINTAPELPSIAARFALHVHYNEYAVNVLSFVDKNVIEPAGY